MQRRTIVHDEQFAREAAALSPDVRGFDDAMRYVEELLSMYPEDGLETDYPSVRVAPMLLPVADTLIPLEASIFYTWDDDRTYLLTIKRPPASGRQP